MLDQVVSLTEEQIFCLLGCRSCKQYHHMRHNFERKICVFCDVDRSLNVPEYEDEYMLAWSVPEAFKRPELAEHLLIVPTRHVRAPWDLNERNGSPFDWLTDA